jgi:hypothetical protein
LKTPGGGAGHPAPVGGTTVVQISILPGFRGEDAGNGQCGQMTLTTQKHSVLRDCVIIRGKLGVDASNRDQEKTQPEPKKCEEF